VPLILKGAASQSANLQEWQTNAGGTVALVSSAGLFTPAAIRQTTSGNLNSFGGAAVSNQIVTIFTGGTANKGLVVQGAASQSANLQEWQNSGGTVIASVSSTGAITTTGLTLSSTTSPITLNASVGTAGQVLTSAGAGATPTWTTVSGGSFTGGTLTSNLTLAANGTATSPLTFQSGTVLTTLVSGAREYDGTVFYQTTGTATGRALDTQNYEYLLTASYFPDYSSTGAAQSILNGTTTGITLLAGTTYEWELYVPYRYQSLGDATTFLSVGWNTSTVSGTPTVAFTEYLEYSANTTSLATASTFSGLFKSTGTTQLTTSPGATGSRYGIWRSKGTIRVTGTGSIKFYPALTASAATVNVITINNGTFFKLTPLGNGTVSTIGTWA
jgi:hypothetical protein